MLAGLLALLSACGFQLREAIDLPDHLQAIKVEGGGAVGHHIRKAIQDTDARLVTDVREATAILRILDERQTRRVLSVDTEGRVNEYELYLGVTIQLVDKAGKVLIPRSVQSQTRNYLFDPNDVLGKDAEEQALFAEMRRELARQVLRRVAFAEVPAG